MARVPAKSMTGIVEEAIMIAVGIVLFWKESYCFLLDLYKVVNQLRMADQGDGEGQKRPHCMRYQLWVPIFDRKPPYAARYGRKGRTVRVTGGGTSGSRYPTESHPMLHVTVNCLFSNRKSKIKNPSFRMINIYITYEDK